MTQTVTDLDDKEFAEWVIDEARGRLDDDEQEWFLAGMDGLGALERWAGALAAGISEAQLHLSELKQWDAEETVDELPKERYRAHRAEFARRQSAIVNHRTKVEARLHVVKARIKEAVRERQRDEGQVAIRCLRAYIKVYGVPGRVVSQLRDEDVDALDQVAESVED